MSVPTMWLNQLLCQSIGVDLGMNPRSAYDEPHSTRHPGGPYQKPPSSSIIQSDFKYVSCLWTNRGWFTITRHVFAMFFPCLYLSSSFHCLRSSKHRCKLNFSRRKCRYRSSQARMDVWPEWQRDDRHHI